MERRIIWLFALVLSLTTQYSTAQSNTNIIDQCSLVEFSRVFFDIYNKFISFKTVYETVRDQSQNDESYVYENPGLISLNDSKIVEELISIAKSFDSLVSKEESFGSMLRVADEIYDSRDIKKNLETVATWYQNHSILFSTNSNYSLDSDSMWNVLSTTNLLDKNYFTLFSVSSITIREDLFSKLLQDRYKDATVQSNCHKLFALYWPLIKSEFQGFFAIFYANLLYFKQKGEIYNGFERTQDKFIERLEKYFLRIPCYYDSCRQDSWGYRTSSPGTIILNEPLPSGDIIHFFMKDAENATIYFHHGNFTDFTFKVEIGRNGFEVYDEKNVKVGSAPIDPSMIDAGAKFQGFWIGWYADKIEMNYYTVGFDHRTLLISDARTTAPHNSTIRDVNKRYTIISNDTGDWMINDVSRSQSTKSSMPTKSISWCDFDGHLPLGAVQLDDGTYVAKYEEISAQALPASWTPIYFDENRNEFNSIDNVPYWNYQSWSKIQILTGCGVRWERPTPQNIRHALVATDRTYNFYPVFICRGNYNGIKSKIGRFNIHHECIVNDGKDHKIDDYEILVQPRE